MRPTPTSAIGAPARPARAGGRSARAALVVDRRRRPRSRARRTARSASRCDRAAAVPVERAGDELLGLARPSRRRARPSRGTCRRCARRRRSRRANEQTAITIALRVPIFENCWPPRAAGMWNAAISSSGSSTLRFGPVMKSSIGMRRVAARRGDLDLGVRRVQRRQRVAGGGGGAEVAADRPAVADLRRADGPRRDREARAARRPAPRSRACT